MNQNLTKWRIFMKAKQFIQWIAAAISIGTIRESWNFSKDVKTLGPKTYSLGTSTINKSMQKLFSVVSNKPIKFEANLNKKKITKFGRVVPVENLIQLFNFIHETFFQNKVY